MKKSFLIISIAAIAFASCKKEKIDPVNPGNGEPGNPVSGMKLVKKSDIWTGTLNFEYNPDSTTKRIYYTQGIFNLESLFFYEAGKVIRAGTTNGVISERDTLILQNGKGVMLIRSFYSNGNQTPYHKDTTTYEYGFAGLLARVNLDAGDYILYTYDNQGDLLHRTTYNSVGQVKYKYDYQYYPEIEKNPYYNQLQGNLFAKYLAPISKHVVKSYKSIDYVNPSTNEYMFTHQYDNDGYVIKSTWWNVATPAQTYVSFTDY